ncbi:MAG TPA: DUF1150 family protein [Alphaproteobacteria bacterium]
MANMFIDPSLRSIFLKNLSHEDFLNLGEGHVVYVRPVRILGSTHYALHHADGEQISVAMTQDHANQMAAEQALEVITVH